jgi:hypothetical protein
MLLVTAVGWGCSSDSTAPEPDPDPVATSIQVTPTSVALEAIGATATVAAVVLDQDGAPIAGASVIWASLDETVATVTAAGGVITAVGVGATTARASSGPLTADVAVTVSQTPASVVVTPATGELLPGATLALSAVVSDTNGNDVAGAAVTWSSGDAAVASVDASTGVVTAVAEGTASIIATAGGATGEAAITVLAPPPDLVIDADGTLGGTVNAGAFSVLPGVTVTLSDDLELRAAGPVTIQGSIVGDCLGVAIESGTAVTLDGASIDAACGIAPSSDDAPGLSIFGPGELTVSTSAIRGSGAVFVGNGPEPDIGALLPPAAELSRQNGFREAGGLRAADASPAACVFENTTIESTGAADGADPADAFRARSVFVSCTADALLENLTVTGAAGNSAPPVVVEGSVAAAKGGESGGFAVVEIDGVATLRGVVSLVGGDAGHGGDATAAPFEPGASATAEGGFGGGGGLPSLRASSVSIATDATLALSLGAGGNGGSATAVAVDGSAGMPGGNAKAVAGPPNRRYPEGSFSIVTSAGSAAFVGATVDAASATRIQVSPITAGSSGDALAIAGRGGDGAAAGAAGAAGGSAEATAHPGGASEIKNLRDEIPDPVVTLGSGGSATWRGGQGGNGVTDICAAGGAGGPGGSALGTGAGSAGSAGPLPGVVLVPGTDGERSFDDFGNGGNGASGTTSAGAAGPGGAVDDALLEGLEPSETADSFNPGAPGGQIDCATAQILALAWTLTADENGHAPFIAFQAVAQALFRLQFEALTIIMRQGGLVPDLDGTLTAPNGAPVGPETAITAGSYGFEMSGEGVVAGFSGVRVTFIGTVDLDDQGNVINLSGEVVVDADNDTLPANGMGERNPAVYQVTGTPQSGAGGR